MSEALSDERRKQIEERAAAVLMGVSWNQLARFGAKAQELAEFDVPDLFREIDRLKSELAKAQKLTPQWHESDMGDHFGVKVRQKDGSHVIYPLPSEVEILLLESQSEPA